MQAGQAERYRVLRERDRVAAFLSHAVHLVRNRGGIPDGWDRERNEAVGRGTAPFLDVPVVVRATERERGVLVVERGKETPGEAGERGEVQRAQYAVGRHVEHPLLHVVGAGPELVEARGVEAVFLRRPSRHRVEPHIRDVEVEELPAVGAVGHVLDPGRDVVVLRGQMVLEQIRRLDHVIIDAHKNHVVHTHAAELRPRPGRPHPPWASFPARAATGVHSRGRVVGRSGDTRPERGHARGAVVPAGARRRRSRKGRHQWPGECGLRRYARGRVGRVPRPDADLARVVERRWLELRVPCHARLPRNSERRRRHGCNRLRQQPALGLGSDAGDRRRRWRSGRYGVAAADGVRVPDGSHARRRVRDGRAASHAPVRHQTGAARVDRGADARARRAQSERDVSRSDHRRRRHGVETGRGSVAQARLLRDLRRRVLRDHDH